MGHEHDAPRDPSPPRDDAVDRHREALKQRFPLPTPQELAPRKKAAKTATLALTALSLIGLAGVIGWDPGWGGTHYDTAVGERLTVALSDGSHIVLDTDSHVEVRPHLRSRQVLLEAGRARFEVAPSRWRPFNVDVGQAAVQVVGTVFDVRRDTDDVEVAVIKGQVKVTTKGDQQLRMLHPGQGVAMRAGFLGAPLALDATAHNDWIDGRLEFEHVSLAAALAELQRYHRQPIVLADPAVAELKVSGVFDSARVDEVLDLLPHILPVSVVRQADGGVRIVAR